MELAVERVVAGGDGLAREPSGRVVLVPGALPGERVEVRLTTTKRDFARAELVDVVTASPARQSAPCRHVADGCGGCTWQHIDPTAQRELKVEIVREALVRTGRLADPEVLAGPALSPWGFRTTLRTGVVDGRLGFRAHRSHAVVPTDGCLVAHPRLVELLDVARAPRAKEVVLRVSAATGERAALVTPASAARAASFPDDVALGPNAAIHEEIGGARLQVSMGSFFQTRADGAQALVDAVRAAADGAHVDGLLVDAYAGVGLFAATLNGAQRITAIEVSPSSCADARANLPEAIIRQQPVETWKPKPADLVVADPARAGLGAAATVLAGTGAPRLVLVSCDPVSLARDARLLAAHGYRHTASTVVDLFPHTPHVEVVTRFDRS